ncbi:hypothetical protein COL154_006824 [Colletotrichum chrysophilum]|uniref:uncharacterized protein n=1 Tax=Colletotrichum chrysophilum TaxID=1836956 RepID=UPI002301A9FE|nr:uncharacterized protein COL26b_007430 [Colletotrichum chrysophilum]KAJ0347430.1 hypothetical protein KNSL1_006482 [Colletotrichum chrysophilum]KAJ0361514.1 hypothetical protein COL154_006824 [Colletotrichum chrysophilum]KAJ0374350.1 hypothetical protein COL26b_007430 [Colletotrichum chrysophilum]
MAQNGTPRPQSEVAARVIAHLRDLLDRQCAQMVAQEIAHQQQIAELNNNFRKQLMEQQAVAKAEINRAWELCDTQMAAVADLMAEQNKKQK